jgi:hypothetical protein
MVAPSASASAIRSSRGLFPRRRRLLRFRSLRPDSGAISAGPRLGVARVKRRQAAGGNVGSRGVAGEPQACLFQAS